MNSSDNASGGITGFGLKIIALVTMLIDHIGIVVLQPYLNAKIDSMGYDLSQLLNKVYAICRSVGRIAFPLFAFMLVEGFFHTRNRWKYLLRLAIFAVLSEIPFNLAIARSAFSTEKQSVLITLTISFLMLIVLDYVRSRAFTEFWCGTLTLAIIAAFTAIGYFLKCDYDFKGPLMIAGIYLLYPLFNMYRFTFCISTGLMFFWEWSKTIRNFPSSLSPMLLCFYNGKKGRSLKYFFYLFYPIHLILLYCISRFFILHY